MMDLPPGYEFHGLELPAPDADAMALSLQLVEKIVARIEANNGVIAFDEYMQMVLYEPGLGYYSGAAIKLGALGDYVTAPELSPLFGQCLATQAEALFAQGCAAQILEFGAGSGRLCAQIIASLPAVERYLILDLSAELKQRQRQYLQDQLSAELFHKIEWLSSLPQDFDGIVLANEVLDAMPVHIVLKQGDWLERGIGFDGQGFEWGSITPDTRVLAAIRGIEARLGKLPDNYCSELNLNYEPWLNALAHSCRRAVVLIIDYGYEQAEYYHPERSGGTLVCHYRHRVHADPLVYPGLQDITAFVDFDALADAAEANGFEPMGLVSQGSFLIANGLLEAAQQQSDDSDNATQAAISQQVKTLSLPQEMGEKFKVLALQKNLALEMPALRPRAVNG